MIDKRLGIYRQIRDYDRELVASIALLRRLKPAVLTGTKIAVIAATDHNFHTFIHYMLKPYRHSYHYVSLDLRWPRNHNYRGIHEGHKFCAITRLHWTEGFMYRELEQEILENHMIPQFYESGALNDGLYLPERPR